MDGARKIGEKLTKKTCVVAAVIAIAVGLAWVSYAVHDSSRKAAAASEERVKAEAFNQYVDRLNAVAEYFMDGSMKAEEAGSLIVGVWSAAINNPYGTWDEDLAPYQAADPNEALAHVLASDIYKELRGGMESAESSIDDVAPQLASPPGGCLEAYDTFKDMYKEFKTMCELVRKPSGTLQDYRGSFDEAHRQLGTLYRLLKAQIPDKMEVPA